MGTQMTWEVILIPIFGGSVFLENSMHAACLTVESNAKAY